MMYSGLDIKYRGKYLVRSENIGAGSIEIVCDNYSKAQEKMKKHLSYNCYVGIYEWTERYALDSHYKLICSKKLKEGDMFGFN